MNTANLVAALAVTLCVGMLMLLGLVLQGQNQFMQKMATGCMNTQVAREEMLMGALDFNKGVKK